MANGRIVAKLRSNPHETTEFGSADLPSEDLSYLEQLANSYGGRVEPTQTLFSKEALEALSDLQKIGKIRPDGEPRSAEEILRQWPALLTRFQDYHDITIAFADDAPAEFVDQVCEKIASAFLERHQDRYEDVYVRSNDVTLGSWVKPTQIDATALKQQGRSKVPRHLQEAPYGLGRISISPNVLPGVDGTGVHLYEVQGSWSLSHPAFGGRAKLTAVPSPPSPPGTPTPTDSDIAHGTRTLGLTIAAPTFYEFKVPNSTKNKVMTIRGFADAALATACPSGTQAGRIPSGTAGRHSLNTLLETLGGYSKLKAMARSVPPQRFASVVVLLELEVNFQGLGLPVEFHLDSHEVIQTLASVGMFVVEPAGNNEKRIELRRDPSKVLQRDRRPIRAVDKTIAYLPPVDPKACLVAGGHFDTSNQWGRDGWTNYGPVINCFAQAGSVFTTDYANQSNTFCGTFNGTSAASAIVAGAALSAFGIAKARPKQLTSDRLRELFAQRRAPGAVSGNTESVPGEDIGVMPNLVWISTQL